MSEFERPEATEDLETQLDQDAGSQLTRRRFLHLLAGAAIPLVGACGSAPPLGGQQPASKPADTSSAPKPAAPAPPAAAPAAQPTAAAASAPAVVKGAAQEIKVGHVNPMTGPLAFEGGLTKNGLLLALEQVNESGGIKSLGGAKLVLVDGDSQNKPEVGAAEVERLAGQGVVALFGSYTSAVTFVTTQAAEKVKVPFLLTGGTADNILDRGFKYSFRILYSTSIAGKQGIGFLQDLSKVWGSPIKSIALLHEDSLYGTSVGNAVEQAAPGAGFQIVSRIPYKATATDLTTELTKIKAAKPDMLIVTGYYPDGVLVAKTFNDLKMAPMGLMGCLSGAFSNPQFLKENPQLAEGVLDANFYLNSKSDKAKEVYAVYEKRFASTFPGSAMYPYMSMIVLADAIERAASIDRDKIRDALAKTEYKNQILPQGDIRFDEKGQNVNANILMLQNQNGKIEVIAPTQYQTAQLKPQPRA